MPEDIDSIYLQVKVTPNAARNAIAGYTDSLLHVKVAAPPVKGKANQELISLLSRTLGVKKSNIKIVKGLTGRNKIIAIDGMKQKEIIDQLLA